MGECEDARPHSGPRRQGQAGGGGQEGGEVPVQVGRGTMEHVLA